MRILRFVVLIVLLGAMSSGAMADGFGPDPRGSLVGGGGSPGLFTPNFDFTVFGGSSPQFFDYINAIGQTVGEVDLTITLLAGTPALTFTVDNSNDPYFTTATVTQLNSGNWLMRFFGMDSTHGGIPNAAELLCDGPNSCSTSTPGADFAIEFSDNPGTLDLTNLPGNEGFSVAGTLVATPEPSTIVLLLGGLVLLILLKRV